MKRTICLTGFLVIVLSVLIAGPAYADDGGTYVVQRGDTLTYIAARHGLTATQLAAANGLRWDSWVYAGQRLRIPGQATQGQAPAAPTAGGNYVVRRGDTLSNISRRYGISVSQLAAANNLRRNAWVYTGQRLTIPGQAAAAPAPAAPASSTAPAAGSGAYIVRPGDTLIRIAMRHGLTAQRLAMANGMHVNAWVYVGQRLTIPDQASPSPGSAAPVFAAPAAGSMYVVRPGDTLIGIAVRHGISVSQLAAANGLRTGAWVYVGQRLKIPGSTNTQEPSPSSVPEPKPTKPPEPKPTGAKWIDVDLSTQTLTAYVGQTAVLRTPVSTGRQYTPTVVGTYRIYAKYLSTHMSGPGYSVPNVPHAMFFYRGYSIHGTYWHNNFGTPMSHGCVNLPLPEAKWLYEWAPVGTKVVTHH